MENLQNEKERELWKLAKKRVSFKRQFVLYLIVNTFLWILWAISDEKYEGSGSGITIPWPVWCSLGWGIGIVFSYYGAYGKNNFNAIEREFEKLKAGN